MRVGQTIDGRFHVEREVTSGGAGRIFRARDLHEDVPIALKVISRGDDESAGRFVREAVLLAQVDHPGVVRYVAHGRVEDGSPYLAMEWLEGEDLAHRLARAQGLPVVDVLVLGRHRQHGVGRQQSIGGIHASYCRCSCAAGSPRALSPRRQRLG